MTQLARSGLIMLFAALALAVVYRVTPAKAQEQSPCSLLTTEDVEGVIGTKLAGPGYRSAHWMPSAAGDTCLYETPDFRAIGVHVEWFHGAQTIGMISLAGGLVSESWLKGMLKLVDGTELKGDWDDARIFMCCEFNALHGDQLVVIDIGGSQATVAQAAALANTAVKRLGQPLTVDDAGAVKAAEDRESVRPKKQGVCSLVTRAEAEAIIGKPLSEEPAEGQKNSHQACSYKWNDGLDQEFNLEVLWRGGFNEFRTTQAMVGQAIGSMKNATGVDLTEAQKPAGALDEKANSILGVSGVKHDVLLSIETGGFMNDAAGALIEKAASHL
jgi:hypothetical protein